jgi:S-formylglutathione hydrolase FrmB
MRLEIRLVLVACLGLGFWSACGDDDNPADAVDAADEGGDAGPERIGDLRPEPGYVGMPVGESRTVRLWAGRPPTVDITLEVAVEADGIVTVPAALTLPAEAWYVDLAVDGEAVGSTTIRVTYDVREATIVADVVTEEVSCAGAGSGTLAPGDVVEGSGGLAEASVAMGSTAELAPFAVTLACAEDIVPAGYTAVGPAVTFAPARRFARELSFTIPVKAGLLPAGRTGADLVIFWRDEHAAARAVPLASVWLTGAPGGGTLRFSSTRLGTFQAAYEDAAGTRTRSRRYTYKGIVGVSMGGGGTSSVGFRNPDRWDFIAPLGGPANWTHMLHYVQEYYLGGFCTASPDDAGDVGEHCAVRPSNQPFEHVQEFENWYYPEGRDGQGGTFDREEYCQIFRDMALALGNPGMYNVGSVYLPPGVPESWWQLPADERCTNPTVLEDFYDDEYNPDGALPVITFCDGAEALLPDGSGTDHGRWDPDGTNDYPLDVGLAVDVDGDGIRDAGEPVIRSGHEPYDDVGLDGLAGALEPGYDALDNPDPSDDDFDYQFNPTGTEGNWRWDGPAGSDPGEPWVDAGLDGVLGTPQQGAGGYDFGEGNDVFDQSPYFQNYLEHDGYTLLAGMADAELDRIEVLADAGIRDLFPFAAGENSMLAPLVARGRQVRFYNDFSALYGGSYLDEQLDPTKIDFLALGRHTMIRYGNPDADETLLVRGDGGHVGTVTQVINRLAYATFAMSARWPGGDRARVASDTASTMISDDFVSPSTGRVSPYSVILPPGYHTEAYADTRYPVVFFLHGYGQDPQDMVTSAIIFQNWMISASLPEDLRMQKLIMVFPDGRCRSPDGTPDYEKECIRGTFYTDSIRPEGPQMETILFELMDYIDETYRTKAPEEVTETY